MNAAVFACQTSSCPSTPCYCFGNLGCSIANVMIAWQANALAKRGSHQVGKALS